MQKRSFLILIALIFISAIATAQHAERRVIDFLNPNLSDTSFDYGKTVGIQVKNINRFLYKVSSEKTVTDFNTKIPAIMSGIKLPAFLSKSVATMQDQTQGLADQKQLDSIAVVKRSNSSNDIFQLIQKNTNNIIQVSAFINTSVYAHNKCVDISKQCGIKYETVYQNANDVLKKELADYNFTADSINEFANEIEEKIIAAVAFSETSAKPLDSLLARWNDAYDSEYRFKIHIAEKQVGTLNEQIAEKTAALTKETNPTKKKAIKAEIVALNEQLYLFKEQTIQKLAVDSSFDKALTAAYVKDAKALLEEIKKYKDGLLAFNLGNDLKKINESNYSYNTEVVKMKKDEVKYSIAFTANEPLTCNQPSDAKFDVVLNTVGGWKIDFSTGVFFNLGNEDFIGKEFYYQAVNDTVSMIKSKNVGNRALLSIGALMHVYKRTNANFKIAGSAGVSTSTGFDNLNFHIGPSFIIGKKERLILSAGFTFRESSYLDKSYETDKQYALKSLPKDLPTLKKFPSTGYFLSLTYNLSSLTN